MNCDEPTRPSDAEDRSETARRIKRSLAIVRRRVYTDYDEEGLRNVVESVISALESEKKRR
jgi:hypothetical protein